MTVLGCQAISFGQEKTSKFFLDLFPTKELQESGWIRRK
jgi:hypothetical protein